MKKLVLGLIVLSSILFVIPAEASSDKIIYEYHDAEELGEYGDETKITLVSDRTNVLVKLKEDYNLDENDFSERDDYLKEKKNKLKQLNERRLNQMSIGYDGIYISKYSPYIEFSYDSSSTDKLNTALKRLEKYDFVDKIYVQDDYKPAVKMGGALDEMNGYSYVRNNALMGYGIHVGLLEWGIVDVDNTNLANSDIVVRDESYYVETESEHATIMAAIICGTNGMAINCTLYSVELCGNPVSELDWLVEQSVSVCNVSIGDGTGSYSSSSEYIDYIADNYGVTFCCAVGNDGEDAYVSNVSLAYNCIAVGIGNHYYASSNNSLLTPDGQFRPMILAPGSVTYTGFSSSSHSGTSVSTALVTGVVTLLQRYNYANRFQFNRFRALLMANATEYSWSEYNSVGLEVYCGAGLVNIQRTINNYSNIYIYENTKALGEYGYYVNTSFSFSEGDRYRFALSYSTHIIDSSAVRNEYLMQTFNPTTEVYLSISNAMGDCFEFHTGDAPGECQLTCQIVQVNAKLTSAADPLYLAYCTISS